MSHKITDIEGIGPAASEKLSAAGIKTVESLLEKGAQKKGRIEISTQSGIPESKILTWINMADLFRIKGVAGENAEILVRSGVDSVKELATRNADNLHEALVKLNNEKKLVRVVPSAATLTKFIAEAKTMDKKVFH